MAKEIFLIDDDTDDLQFFCDALETIDPSINCRDFSGCKEALDFFYGVPEPPICMFIDLSMPKVDGIDCLKVIRSDGMLKHVPVFIISGHVPEDTKPELIALGVAGFVTKPDNVGRLRKEISSLLLPLLPSGEN